MNVEDCIEDLENLWADEAGFLFQLRMGRFDPMLATDFLAIVREIHGNDGETLPARAVALLWYVPLFMGWQSERIDPNCRAELERVTTLVTNHLEGVLGVP